MRSVVRGNRFLADIKRLKRRGYAMQELYAVIDLLSEDGKLPAAFNPHRLSREWAGAWECHVDTDWLLIYEVTDQEVFLHRTGTHLDLFR
jgi:mRNA interferase YafQ